jgi:diguanylate cyclase (GGDEF)-like protein
METLDLRSIGLTLSLSGFALTAVLWAARRDGDQIAGLDAWLLSAAMMSAGLGLSSLQGWIPDWAARVLGNVALVTAPVLAWQGSRLFRGVPTDYKAAIAAALWTLLWGIVFVYIAPSARMRIFIVSVTMAIACAAAGRDFLLQRQTHLSVSARFGGIPLVTFAVMMSIRAVDALLRQELEVNGALNPTNVNVATYLLGSIVLLCAIAGMVMSVTATRAAQIRDLAYRDLLTAVLSRRGLYAALPLWCRRHGSGATVAVLDINGFKQVNDALGHEKGDQVLQALASACTETLPPDSLIARFGGDEFVALMPKGGSFSQKLELMAEQFHRRCAALLGKAADLRPTVAFGQSTLRGLSAQDFDMALREADGVMYAQKVRQR